MRLNEREREKGKIVAYCVSIVDEENRYLYVRRGRTELSAFPKTKTVKACKDMMETMFHYSWLRPFLFGRALPIIYGLI